MTETVLDASALLALLNAEEGAELVQDLLPEALVSSVNLAEVVTRLCAAGMPEAEIRDLLALLGMESTPFDHEQALQTGLLYAQAGPQGLSLGDRACLALARTASRPAVTADRAWARIDLGIEIRLIR